MKRLLPILLMLFSIAVSAESGSYRVEVIVFRNLLTAAEVEKSMELRSFSEFPDLWDNTQTPDSTNDVASEPASGGLRTDLPDDLRVVTQKSDAMDHAWRRLRSSQNYRPLVYTAWDQNRVDYYPPIRIHNEQLIDTQLRAPTPVLVADLTADDPLAAYRSNFFRIDGSLQLKRSRFLHLFLDLEFRETSTIDTAGGEATGASGLPAVMGSNSFEPGEYAVYTLAQNRQISTGEMQYFDTPYFGALVYVSSINMN